MPIYISMLRGINVGGKNQIRMETLRSLYESLGFEKVQTYVQSGNVVFKSKEEAPVVLAKRIEAKIRQEFGLDVHVMVRTRDDIRCIVANNPFLQGLGKDITKLHVTFLDGTVEKELLWDVKSPNADGDEFSVGEREVYIFCPNGYGRTKLNNNFFEKKLKLPATTRNWNSVKALFELASQESTTSTSSDYLRN